MNTPIKGKRRHNVKELREKYAQKKGPTKAQRRLEARQQDFETNRLAGEATRGLKYHKPGSLK